MMFNSILFKVFVFLPLRFGVVTLLLMLVLVVVGMSLPAYKTFMDLNGDGVGNIADARRLVLYFDNPFGQACQ